MIKQSMSMMMATALVASMPALSQETEPRGIDRVNFTEEMKSLPDLPSRYHCEQLVADGNADQEAFDRCLRMEEVAYNELAETFMDYPAQARTMCGNSVLGMDMGYMGLRYCLKRND